MYVLDEKFRKAMPNYILQSLLAIVTLVIILFFLDILAKAAIVAALGSSAFITFAMPKSRTAQTRNVIGGHIIGLISGSLCFFTFLYLHLPSLNEEILRILAGAIAVGLSIFGMTITDTEHPPAGGTALGIVAHGWTFQTMIFVLVFAIMLSVIRYLLKSRLKELV